MDCHADACLDPTVLPRPCVQVPGVPYDAAAAAPAYIAGPMQPGVGYPAASAALPPPVRRPVAIEAPGGGGGGDDAAPSASLSGAPAGRGGGRRYSAMSGMTAG